MKLTYNIRKKVQEIRNKISKTNQNKPKPSKNNKPKTIVKIEDKEKIKERLANPYLISIVKKTTRLDLPEKGSFNAGLVKYFDKYICVYRPDEYSFKACILNKNLSIDTNTYFKFKSINCSDPRLIWVGNKLLMVYSSTEEVGIRNECIRGGIIMDLDKSNNFIDFEQFRISPKVNERNKNWVPFIYNDKIYLIAHISPHVIYEFDLETKNCELKYKTNWISPWSLNGQLRGNTNVVKLDDGNYLNTFHTANWYGKTYYYDNGAYIFEGKPPFNVIKCANRTYMKAEDAVEPYFRKKDIIKCTFPVGLVKENDNLLISYGDNDSCVKIAEITVKEMENLMVQVYNV